MLFGAIIRWELTMRCNLSGRHCQVGGRIVRRGGHLNREEIRAVLDNIEPGDVSRIVLIGGEPLSCPHIFMIIERLAEKGISFDLITNGLLINNRFIRLMSESGGNKVMISLEGAGPETHDTIRGPGTFAPTVNNIRRLVKSIGGTGSKVGVICTLNATTVNHISDMIGLASSLDVDELQFDLLKNLGNAKSLYGRMGVGMEASANALLNYYRNAAGEPARGRPKVAFNFLGNLEKEFLNVRLGTNMPPACSIFSFHCPFDVPLHPVAAHAALPAFTAQKY